MNAGHHKRRIYVRKRTTRDKYATTPQSLYRTDVGRKARQTPPGMGAKYYLDKRSRGQKEHRMPLQQAHGTPMQLKPKERMAQQRKSKGWTLFHRRSASLPLYGPAQSLPEFEEVAYDPQSTRYPVSSPVLSSRYEFAVPGQSTAAGGTRLNQTLDDGWMTADVMRTSCSGFGSHHQRRLTRSNPDSLYSIGMRIPRPSLRTSTPVQATDEQTGADRFVSSIHCFKPDSLDANVATESALSANRNAPLFEVLSPNAASSIPGHSSCAPMQSSFDEFEPTPEHVIASAASGRRCAGLDKRLSSGSQLLKRTDASVGLPVTESFASDAPNSSERPSLASKNDEFDYDITMFNLDDAASSQYNAAIDSVSLQAASVTSRATYFERVPRLWPENEAFDLSIDASTESTNSQMINSTNSSNAHVSGYKALDAPRTAHVHIINPSVNDTADVTADSGPPADNVRPYIPSLYQTGPAKNRSGGDDVPALRPRLRHDRTRVTMHKLKLHGAQGQQTQHRAVLGQQTQQGATPAQQTQQHQLNALSIWQHKDTSAATSFPPTSAVAGLSHTANLLPGATDDCTGISIAFPAVSKAMFTANMDAVTVTPKRGKIGSTVPDCSHQIVTPNDIDGAFSKINSGQPRLEQNWVLQADVSTEFTAAGHERNARDDVIGLRPSFADRCAV